MTALLSRLFPPMVPMIVVALMAAGCSHADQDDSDTQVASGSTATLPSSPNHDMVAAASHFIEVLSPELRTRAVFAFDGPEMKDWHFVPRKRPGLPFRDMTDAQRIAARSLLRTALSPQGLLKCESIMALDTVLHDMEVASGGDGASRDSLNYAICIFGSPADSTVWGWRIEGHHLCLNFTSDSNQLTSVTPSFMGTNPGEIKTGPKAGLRVLSLEEDLGRQLVTSLDEAQRQEAILAKEAPADVLTVPGRALDAAIPDPQVGLPVSKMNPGQRALVERLLLEFSGNLRHDLADSEMARIRKGDVDAIRFAWAGGIEPGRGHYYRLVGPTFIIEYDNTQNNANHVHTIWHDRQRDFGRDLLKEHLGTDHDRPRK